MTIIDLGLVTSPLELRERHLITAAEEAQRLGYDGARITLRGARRQVVLFIMAGEPEAGVPENFLAAPALPPRPEHIGWHPGDTSRP